MGGFSGEIKTVVVWKLDRLSRNQRDGINLLAELCDRGNGAREHPRATSGRDSRQRAWRLPRVPPRFV